MTYLDLFMPHMFSVVSSFVTLETKAGLRLAIEAACHPKGNWCNFSLKGVYLLLMNEISIKLALFSWSIVFDWIFLQVTLLLLYMYAIKASILFMGY